MNNKRLFQRKAIVSAITAAGLLGTPMLASAQGASQLEEVIVTASARQQSMQDIPYNISAMSGDAMEAQQITDQAGWEALRACRKSLAEQQGVPPYVIFHDTTLFDMLERRPATLSELAEVNGVGAAKLEKYGETFLHVLGELNQD